MSTRTPPRALWRISSGAFAMPMSTVGAAQSIVIDSFASASKIFAGSTRRKHTCVPPIAVTVQVNVHPFAWNIGSVHK